MAYSKWRAAPISTAFTTGQVDNKAADSSFNGGVYGGYTFRNTTVAAIQVDIYDNTSAAGTLLGSIDLTAKGSVGASATVMPDGEGVRYTNGVFVACSAAGVQGSVFLG